MKVVFDPCCLEFKTAHHPESPERIRLICHQLKSSNQFEFVRPKPAKREDLLLVHSKALVEEVKENTFFDPDTPNIPGIFDYALAAVSCAMTASEIALRDGFAFSLARPPGHHATKNQAGGFCYFNNLAVAVAKLLQKGKKAAILDIDVHHGNGTEDIFMGKKGVIFCSLHQFPLYPGTGERPHKNCLNYPLPAGADFTVYKKYLLEALVKIEKFSPDILAVSLGFDTYLGDLLAQLSLQKKDYYAIGSLIKKLNLPTFFVLEGGYSKDIGFLAFEFFKSYTACN